MSADDVIPPSPSYPPEVARADDAAFFAVDEPFALMAAWLKQAGEKEPNDPNAMALATADAEGAPDVRMVLLKGLDARGLVFYTNAESAKGAQLAANARAAACFHWKSLRRQVRARGPVELVSDAEADAYFASRDRGARIGAWASEQSRPLPDGLALEKRLAAFTAKFGLGAVPRPAHWRGYRLIPLSLEFWRNQPFRLHDRMAFVRAAPDAPWDKRRLYP
jgi:pyridoxamine 5'-phosphate oxidase